MNRSSLKKSILVTRQWFAPAGMLWMMSLAACTNTVSAQNSQTVSNDTESPFGVQMSHDGTKLVACISSRNFGVLDGYGMYRLHGNLANNTALVHVKINYNDPSYGKVGVKFNVEIDRDFLRILLPPSKAEVNGAFMPIERWSTDFRAFVNSVLDDMMLRALRFAKSANCKPPTTVRDPTRVEAEMREFLDRQYNKDHSLGHKQAEGSAG
jgi:hypothetical protein